MSKATRAFRQDLKAIFWAGSGLFLTLALASYSPTDLSFNTIRSVGRVENSCGYLGSFLSDLLYQLFGLTSWIFVLICFQQTIFYVLRKNREGASIKWVWGFTLLLSVSSLLSLHFPNIKFFSEQIYLGGVLGYAISRGLVSALNPQGVAILLWSVTLALMILFTEKPLGTWVLDTVKWPLSLVGAISNFFFARIPKVNFGAVFSWINKKPSANSVHASNTIAREDKTLFTGRGATDTPETESSILELANEEQNSTVVDETKQRRGLLGSQLSLFQRSSGKPARSARVIKPQIIENWNMPDLSLLPDPDRKTTKIDEREIRRKADVLTDKLAQFDVNGEVVGIRPGPAVTLFEFKPNADVKISKITELADDLSLALSSESVRIIAPIPGRDVVGIETSNSSRETVFLKDVISEERFWTDKTKLPISLGREANGDPRVVDLRKMPHLLVAGTTGSGKSVFVVSSIAGLLFRHSPKTLRFILIDPKQVDLAAFNRIPHLLMPPIREAKKAVTSLKWAIREMDKRYRSMSQFGARGLESFNETVEKLTTDQVDGHRRINGELEQQRKSEQYYFEPQPYIVIVVEEFGDLMAVDRVNVEQAVVRLAQMARACGIHLILAMQSPRKDVVTGLIKTNIPGRISFKVASKMDSRIILDDAGAERLLAQGDMLFLAPGVSKPQRHHGPWLTEEEIQTLCEFWSTQGEPQYDTWAMKALDGGGGGYNLEGPSDFSGDDGDDLGGGDEDLMDEKYDEILAWVATVKEVSASLLQRRFRLGYPRAARMIEIFEREGVVGPAQGSKPRQVLVSSYAPAPDGERQI